MRVPPAERAHPRLDRGARAPVPPDRLTPRAMSHAERLAPPDLRPPVLTAAPRTERIRTVVVDDHADLARLVAARIATLVREKAASGERAVLGLATGSIPIGMYRELIRMHREEGLSFAGVTTFNLDEYYPMPPDSIHSYHRFM